MACWHGNDRASSNVTPTSSALAGARVRGRPRRTRAPTARAYLDTGPDQIPAAVEASRLSPAPDVDQISQQRLADGWMPTPHESDGSCTATAARPRALGALTWKQIDARVASACEYCG